MIYKCDFGGPRDLDPNVAMQDYEFSTSTCSLAAPTSTVPSVVNGFSHGEILIFSGVFAIFFLALYAFYWFSTFGVKSV